MPRARAVNCGSACVACARVGAAPGRACAASLEDAEEGGHRLAVDEEAAGDHEEGEEERRDLMTIRWQSEGNQMPIRWQSDANRVAMRWQSGGHRVVIG